MSHEEGRRLLALPGDGGAADNLLSLPGEYDGLLAPKSYPYDGMRVCGGRFPAGPWNIVLIALTLLLAFSSFNPLQFAQTTLYPKSAEMALGCLYGALGLTNLFASAQVAILVGEKVSFLFGAVGFVAFLAAQVSMPFMTPGSTAQLAVYYASTALMGIGGSFMYTAMGSMVVICSPPASLGKWNGVLFGIYTLNFCVGGLVMQFLPVDSNKVLYTCVMAGIGVSSIVPLLLVHQPRSMVVENANGRRYSLTPILRLFTRGRFLLMIPSILYSGLFLTFAFGVMSRFTVALNLAGYCLVALGVGEILSSFIGGVLADRLGRYTIYALGTVPLAVGAYLLSYFAEGRGWYMYVFAYLLMGASDGLSNVAIYSTLAQYSDPTEGSQPSFSYFKLLQAAGTAGGFLLNPYLSSDAHPVIFVQIVLYVLLGAGAVCLGISHRFVANVDSFQLKPPTMQDEFEALMNVTE